MEHRGNSCEAVENSDKSSVQLFRRSYSFWRKGSGMTFLPVNISEDILLKPKSQNWDWYVIMINTKGKLMALFVGTRWVQNCEKRFQNAGGHKFSDSDWLQYIHKATRMPETCYWRFVLFKDTLVGHVAIPDKWKEFLFRRGCSNDVISILQAGLQFWQTRSHATIVCISVPADCIDKVISQKGERTLYERLSTPGPAPKRVLKSAWQSQQQQQQQDTSESSASGSTRKTGAKRGPRYPNRQPRTTQHLETDAKCWVTCWERRAWVLSRPQNLRNCTRCNPKRWRKNGASSRSCWQITNWIPDQINYWRFGEDRKSIKFSEEFSRAIHELGNIELHELGQICRTDQCQSCLKHVPEGLIFCSCGICLRPDEEQIQWIKAPVEAIIVPYYLARVNYSRGNRHGEAQWQKDHSEARDARRGARRKNHDSIVLRWQNDEMYRESQKVHGWTEDYCWYLDCLTKIDISHSATPAEAYENTI